MQRCRVGHVGQTLAHGWDDARDRRGAEGQIIPERFRLRLADVRRDSFGKRRERRCPLAVVTPAPENQCVGLQHLRRERRGRDRSEGIQFDVERRGSPQHPIVVARKTDRLPLLAEELSRRKMQRVERPHRYRERVQCA